MTDVLIKDTRALPESHRFLVCSFAVGPEGRAREEEDRPSVAGSRPSSALLLHEALISYVKKVMLE